jgi:beta-N-acetylglucosaminidase
MNIDPTLLSSLGTIISVIAIVISLLRTSKSSSMEHVERLIQYQNSQFSATLDDKLDKKFEDMSRETNRRFEELSSKFIDKGTMELRSHGTEE